MKLQWSEILNEIGLLFDRKSKVVVVCDEKKIFFAKLLEWKSINIMNIFCYHAHEKDIRETLYINANRI